MYTSTHFAKVHLSALDFMPKFCTTKQEISFKPKAEMKFPSRINGSDVSLALDKYPLLNIFTDTYTLNKTDNQTKTIRNEEKGPVSKHNFQVRFYETGADFRLSHSTILNYFQEVAINWFLDRFEGGSGVARTPEMIKQNLIWVMAKTRSKIDRYPTWKDKLQSNTWLSVSRKGGLVSCNSIFCDAKTGEILVRVSSLIVMMNSNTRKACKAPDEVMAEMEPYVRNVSPFVHEDNAKLPKLDDNTADVILKKLTPKWTDLDCHQHVNNVKYVTWIFESIPEWLGLGHEATSIVLEYRRECAANHTLQSLVSISPVSPSDGDVPAEYTGIILQSQHLIRLEDGADILRARIKWKPRKQKLSSLYQNRY